MTRVAVAVSGGMDSLLALALLKEQGQDLLALHGFFLPPDDEAREKTAALEEQCARLDIPFAAVDLSAEFARLVISPFVASYLSGRTPNPCALCNRELKFGLLFAAARDMGATRLATGHYARLVDHPIYCRGLARGADPVKEQSYFLGLVRARDLRCAVFPLGDWRKKDVPAALVARGLTPPLASESQEVCFVPGDDYKTFLEASGAKLPGPGAIVHADGRTLGRHRGLWRYTLGQRRGLGVAFAEPLYVLGADREENALLVGGAELARTRGCRAEGVNVLVPPALWPDKLFVRTRYRQAAARAEVRLDGESLEVVFAAPHDLAAPGQVAAVYDASGVVLAAGIIAENSSEGLAGRAGMA